MTIAKAIAIAIRLGRIAATSRTAIAHDAPLASSIPLMNALRTRSWKTICEAAIAVVITVVWRISAAILIVCESATRRQITSEVNVTTGLSASRSVTSAPTQKALWSGLPAARSTVTLLSPRIPNELARVMTARIVTHWPN